MRRRPLARKGEITRRHLSAEWLIDNSVIALTQYAEAYWTWRAQGKELTGYLKPDDLPTGWAP